MKNTKGITLIALVITIIVLLILAGISINMLSGNNSILYRATDAKEKSNESEAEEKLKIALAGLYTNYYTSNDNEENIRDYIFSTETGKGQEQLKSELGEDKIEFNTTKNQITCEGIKFDVAENGTITVKQPADPNQGFWINDTQISTHSLQEILLRIKTYLECLAINDENIPSLSEYGVSSITGETLSGNYYKFILKFTEYNEFELQATVGVETDADTGDSRTMIGNISHNITAIYRSPEITNENDSVSLDNGFADILQSLEASAYNNIMSKLNH